MWLTAWGLSLEDSAKEGLDVRSRTQGAYTEQSLVAFSLKENHLHWGKGQKEDQVPCSVVVEHRVATGVPGFQG